MNERMNHEEEPCYVISVAARMVGMHAQSLRHYERVGLVRPSRSQGRQRLYSAADVARLRQIQRLIQDLGVNLAGAEVIIRMNERIRQMEGEMGLRSELQGTGPGAAGGGGGEATSDLKHHAILKELEGPTAAICVGAIHWRHRRPCYGSQVVRRSPEKRQPWPGQT
jgi:MerR family transcriptional regulator/heat shock protein HspR